MVVRIRQRTGVGRFIIPGHPEKVTKYEHGEQIWRVATGGTGSGVRIRPRVGATTPPNLLNRHEFAHYPRILG